MIDANKAAIEENKGAITATNSSVQAAQSRADSAYSLASSAQSNANGRARIQIVSYAGTGTAAPTESNPVSVTFSFKPSYVIMLGDKSGNYFHNAHRYGNAASDGSCSIVQTPFKEIAGSTFHQVAGFGNGLSSTYQVWGRSSGNTLYWYVEGRANFTAGNAFNLAGVTYYVLAIG